MDGNALRKKNTIKLSKTYFFTIHLAYSNQIRHIVENSITTSVYVLRLTAVTYKTRGHHYICTFKTFEVNFFD